MARETRTGPKSVETGREYRLTCSACDNATIHLVLNSAEFVREYLDGSFGVDYCDTFQIVECRGCQTVSFRHCSSNSEDVNLDPETGEPEEIETETLYPGRLKGRKQLAHVYRLPATVQRIYLETLGALTNSFPILVGIGIRALVEAMCHDRSATGRNLEERLDSLVSQGVVSKEGAEILHGLRLMGNKAAHEVTPPKLGDLNVAFDVIEHALEGVYILPELSAKLPRRKPRLKAADDTYRAVAEASPE